MKELEALLQRFQSFVVKDRGYAPWDLAARKRHLQALPWGDLIQALIRGGVLPRRLFHGTTPEALPFIQRTGLAALPSRGGPPEVFFSPRLSIARAIGKTAASIPGVAVPEEVRLAILSGHRPPAQPLVLTAPTTEVFARQNRKQQEFAVGSIRRFLETALSQPRRDLSPLEYNLPFEIRTGTIPPWFLQILGKPGTLQKPPQFRSSPP